MSISARPLVKRQGYSPYTGDIYIRRWRLEQGLEMGTMPLFAFKTLNIYNGDLEDVGDRALPTTIGELVFSK
jgi:hypothetical protein